MQGLLIFLLIGWFVVRALNSKSGETKKSARRSPRQMRDVSTLSGQFRAAAQKREAAQEPRDTAAVSQARPARPKDEPCRECETDFGYRPAAPNRISDPRPAVETAARADVRDELRLSRRSARAPVAGGRRARRVRARPEPRL